MPARTPSRKAEPRQKATSKVGAARTTRSTSRNSGSVPAKPVRMLSGGNPQIPKGDGDAPVQAYIAALPGWKADIVRWLDTLVVSNVPRVRKAVKWNSPFYGVDGQGWFLAVHVFTHYVKVTFFKGASLQPLPPRPSKDKDVRYVDIRQDAPRDDAQMVKWVKQAAALPGWMS